MAKQLVANWQVIVDQADSADDFLTVIGDPNFPKFAVDHLGASLLAWPLALQEQLLREADGGQASTVKVRGKVAKEVARNNALMPYFKGKDDTNTYVDFTVGGAPSQPLLYQVAR
jgi:hypothetical protein